MKGGKTDNKSQQNNTCADEGYSPKTARKWPPSFLARHCFHFIPEMWKPLAWHINGPYEDTGYVGVSHRCDEFYGHIPFHYVSKALSEMTPANDRKHSYILA